MSRKKVFSNRRLFAVHGLRPACPRARLHACVPRAGGVRIGGAGCVPCCVCCVCALRARVVRYVFCVTGVCVCVCCVCVTCAWQKNQHLKDGEMNCQTNCCHQTKKWIPPMQAASPLACGPAAASPHIHTTSTCVHFAKQKPTCNTDTKTPKHTCKTDRPLFKLPP